MGYSLEMFKFWQQAQRVTVTPPPKTPSAQEVEDLLHRMAELRGMVDAFMERLAAVEPTLLQYEQTAERALEQICISNDAQAGRYFELKKRLDAYDRTFQQLGVLITKQPISATPAS